MSNYKFRACQIAFCKYNYYNDIILSNYEKNNVVFFDTFEVLSLFELLTC